MKDVGTSMVPLKAIKTYLKAKGSCILTRTVEQYIDMFAPYVGTFADERTKRCFDRE